MPKPREIFKQFEAEQKQRGVAFSDPVNVKTHPLTTKSHNVVSKGSQAEPPKTLPSRVDLHLPGSLAKMRQKHE